MEGVSECMECFWNSNCIPYIIYFQANKNIIMLSYTTIYDIQKGNEPIFDMNKIYIQQHNSCNTFLLLEQQLL